MELFEVIAEVRTFVNAEDVADAEDCVTKILNEFVADIINIEVK